MRRNPKFSDSVFLNCPFDREYAPLFEAIVFCIIDAGFVPRSALEEQDSGDMRLSKLSRIIGGSAYAIHDISRVTLDPKSRLPRFNMPFELGIDIGCRMYSAVTNHGKKKCLVLEAELYRYQAFISDIAGQDIKDHRNDPDRAIDIVRNWLRASSLRKDVPGAAKIKQRFNQFSLALPKLCKESGLNRKDILFVEYVALAEEWLKANS